MDSHTQMDNVQINTGERGAVVISNVDKEGDGEWSNVVALTIIPLHSIVLPDGKILCFGSTEEGMQGGDFVYSIFDPETGVEKVLENTTATNIFCSNMALDPETGNVIIFGGDGNRNGGGGISGIDSVTIFDYRTQTMTSGEPMEYARWYPSNITLANGDILVLGGRDRDYKGSTIPEVYDGETGTFRQLTGAEMPDLFGGDGSLYESWWYPHVWQNSSGEIIVVEAQGDDIYRLSVDGDGSVEKIGKTGFESYKLNTSNMYDVDKVAIIGDDGGIYVADISDLSQAPVFEKVAELENARTNAAMISLPDGRVLIVGGSTPYGDDTDQGNGMTNAVYTPTIWDPSDNSVTQMDEQAMARLYHSSGLLMPDGSIWSGGGGAPGPQVNTNVEFFNPDYFYGPDGNLADRPEITGAPKNIEAGDTFTITVDDTSDISMISAIRSGAMTHARNLDTRFVKLEFTVIDATTIEVKTPNANVLGPGAWMTFVVDSDGVPSEASIIGVNMVEIVDTPPLEQTTLTYFDIDHEQINGAFELTVDARFDDIDAGQWQRVFDFGNGPAKDNIWLGQVADTDDMRFEIFVDGKRYAITAQDAIEEGVRAEWRVSVDDTGYMRMWKDGTLVANAQGAVPADVERVQNFIGDSNWTTDTRLVGEVRNLEIVNNPESLTYFNIEEEQIDGAFELTVEARFDDLSAGRWQRVFDFGNGPSKDNIWLGQAYNSDDMRFEIYVEGVRYAITAQDAIEQGVRSEWKVSVDDTGYMRMWKDGVLVAEGQGAVPADVDRANYYIGDSNWSNDATLVGEVSNLVIENLTHEPTPDPVLPVLSISAPADVAEGDAGEQGALVYTVTLDQASQSDVTAEVAISGGATGPSTITIPAGETSVELSLSFDGDNDVDGDETITVTLSNPTGATGTDLSATATILDDDEAATGVVINAGDEGGHFYGTEGDDTFNGGDGVDVFIGGQGDDLYDGAGGHYNQVDYSGAAADYTFTRNADGSVTVTSEAEGTDTLKNIDGLWFNGEAKWYALDDLAPPVATGGQAGKVINAGNDGGYFNGTAGDDTFNGGDGLDVFHGGLGNDTYDGAGGYYNQVDFDGHRADYQFSENPDGTITAIHQTYGEDVLKNIDGVWFLGDEAWASTDDLVNNGS